MSEVNSIKFRRNTIAWMKIVHLDIKFKIYWVSKSIPAAKSHNFVNISEAQKPTWGKFLEFGFFYMKRQCYIDITRTKINLWSYHLYT